MDHSSPREEAQRSSLVIFEPWPTSSTGLREMERDGGKA
jgi:hypothetical protein